MDIFESGETASGIYTLNIGDGGTPLDVFCDMTLLGGGWTVIQRRVSNATSFNRTWLSYKIGFGNLGGNFWLGLENIHRLTNSQSFELYIGLESFFTTDNQAFARYDTFEVGGEASSYTLTVGGYDPTSTAGDSMTDHSGKLFSTPDRDNDVSATTHCAKYLSSGWWFESCFSANLNGIHYESIFVPDISVPDGIMYTRWVGDTVTLKTAVMAIRPKKVNA